MPVIPLAQRCRESAERSTATHGEKKDASPSTAVSTAMLEAAGVVTVQLLLILYWYVFF